MREVDQIVGLKTAEHLRQLMSPHCIRRGDSVLPGGGFRINRQIRTLPMTAEQRQLYATLKSEAKALTQESPPADRMRIATALAQALVAPWVWEDGRGKESPKLNALGDWLDEEGAGRQVVVFCKYLRSCALASEFLTAKGVTHGVYTGEVTSGQERHDLVDQFARGELRVFITSGAGHRGVDGLQKASYDLMVMDVVHQPATLVQLIGRLARMGQSHHVVNVLFLLMEGSAETKVMTVLHDRQTVADRIFSEDRSNLFDGRVEDLLLEHL